MVVSRKKEKLLYLSIALLISSLTLYFSISTITGKHGLLTLIHFKKEINYNKLLLKVISFGKEKLNNKVFGLYEESLDLLDERAKNALVYVNPNELVVVLDVQ
ncbi:septum formation initiator family protein [Wolbachia endosymbiont of Cylisticus convexus]|uniref:septum formation initiator family protein n=1 Tax=Wolbachia endosymbiont of Cylisticus convexus TaxID=118728 RepID=UPI000DF6EE12|nr:septum formation initiator family protein [Wolbachia endosymbiont of Cylisticus convexus]